MRGQAALIIVFGLGMAGILAAIAFGGLGPSQIIGQRAVADSDKALFAAQSGIEELMVRLRSHHNFGPEWSLAESLDNGAVYYATISGDLSSKVATATGVFGDFTRRIEIKVASSSSKTSFVFAVHVGEGGLEMESNTEIRGIDGTPGNVYSNGDILGADKSGSRVKGQVWAVGRIDGLGNKANRGVLIDQDAHAGELVRCAVSGDAEAPVPPGSNCTVAGEFRLADTPPVAEMQTVDIEFWKQQAAQVQVWTGDCVVSKNGGPSDCSGVAKELGSMKIEGNLTIESNVELTLTGPLWVEGEVELDSNNKIYVDESLGSEGAVVIADYPDNQLGRGKISVDSNVNFFQTSAGGPVVLVSTNTEESCLIPAIRVSSNTSGVVFLAMDGCVLLESFGFARDVLGQKVHMSQNSTIEFDPRLGAVILQTGLGGWAVTSYNEL